MKSAKHVRTFEMAVPVAELFPLFSPEGEKRWVPGWDYENVTEATGISEDHVFLTKTHDHRAADAIWIVKKYDPASHVVQFYKIEPEEKVGIITVGCSALEATRTRVQVAYEYVALSAKGNNFVSEFNAAAYDAFISEWRGLLTSYFSSEDRHRPLPPRAGAEGR